MKYLLDSNVFIEAKNRYYGLDFCPAFWDWLIQENSNGKVFSIEKVKDEIEAGGDELSLWASNFGSEFFLKPDEAIFPALGTVSNWAKEQNYEQSALNTFFQAADYYLVSHALPQKFTVVTHELFSDSQKRIKIPNVCLGLDIKFMTPYQMLRIEKAKFVLGGNEK
jgi:hypothetical protein